MIVPSMNMDEIINEIKIQYPYVTNKANLFADKLRRQAVKNKVAEQFFKLTDNKLNNWLIHVKMTKKICNLSLCLYYNNSFGFNIIKISDGYFGDTNKANIIVHYSAHFLERYNERFLNIPNLSKIEIFKEFLKNNNYDTFEMSPKNKEIFNLINDGIALGCFDQINNTPVFYNKTYIRKDMLFDKQYKNLNLSKEFYDYMCNLLRPKPIIKQKNILPELPPEIFDIDWKKFGNTNNSIIKLK